MGLTFWGIRIENVLEVTLVVAAVELRVRFHSWETVSDIFTCATKNRNNGGARSVENWSLGVLKGYVHEPQHLVPTTDLHRQWQERLLCSLWPCRRRTIHAET